MNIGRFGKNIANKIIILYGSIQSSGIDNYLFFDMIGTIVYKEYNHDGIEFFLHEYDEDVDNTVIYDYALNTDHILSIIPASSSWKITDEEFLEIKSYL